MVARLYEKWPSYNKFLCAGLIIQGPDRIKQLKSFLMIIIPLLVFWAYTCPFLIRHQQESGIALTAVSCGWSFFTIIVFLISGNMDPGIIRRQSTFYENPFDTLPRSRDVQLEKASFSEKFCETCKIYRPPRVSHCSECSNCVEEFDHHCPWLGNCVGRRNYRFYLLFIWSVFGLCIFVAGCCVWHIVLISYQSHGFGRLVLRVFLYTTTSWILAGYCLVAAFFIFILVSFHLKLLYLNQTTNEYIKRLYIGPNLKKNPFYVGPFKYFLRQACNSKSYRYIDPREEWSEHTERSAFPPVSEWPVDG